MIMTPSRSSRFLRGSRTPRTLTAMAGARLETLEQRQMMALLGVQLTQLPLEFYDASGRMNYDVATGAFDSAATPTGILLPTGPRAILGGHGDFQIHARVDGAGNFVRGAAAGDSAVLGSVNASGDDLVIRGACDIDGNGSIDPLTETGVLLSGEMYAFGFQDSGGPTDNYDFKFVPTGGLLASYFTNRDIGLTMISEGSTFTGSFNSDFSGGSKGTLGPIAAPAASIAGNVYHDRNNDGTFQGTESGISGATVTLTGTDDIGRSVNLTTTTSGTGAYAFLNLRPGTYTLTETQPAGYLDGIDTQGTPGNGTSGNDVFANITLVDGTNGVNNNFGEILASSIAGNVYYDANNNGVFEGTETGLSGVTVTLTGTDDLGASVSLTTTTNGFGAYAFTGLRPGTYQLNESQPGGYLDGIDTVGTPGGATINDQFGNIVLPAGFDGVNNNFGEILASSIAGNVYYDANNNGVFEGTESGISGVKVTLTGTDDLGNSVVLDAFTNGTGAYLFTGLRPGTYQLTESQPSGYLDGIDTIGTPGGATANDQFSAIVLPAGYDGVNNNFGEILASSIAGNVYYDANNNGVFENTETGISGVTVTLTGTDDLGASVSLTTTTDGLGAYSFTGLRPGTYVLTESQPAGYLDGIDTIGTPGGTTVNDQFSNIVLPAGYGGANNNFGEVLAASIAGNVYYDANNNGVFEGAETGVSGATVTLTGTDDLGNSVSLTAFTNGAGAYAFNGLRPGTYVLTESQPAGYLDGRDTIGTPGGATANDQFSNIVLPAGFNGVNNNFGEILASSLAGNVYFDANNNGIFEGTESGISGATVTLTGTDDLGNSVSLTTTTNGFGAYAFTGLRPGTYVITESQPAGYLDGRDTIGTPGGSTANDQFSNIVLNAGVNGINNNFGEILASSLAGNVYYDANNNGIFEGTETGISGATVTLTGTDDRGASVTRTATTSGTGAYSFTGLRPGTYVIIETQPAGYLDGRDTIGTPGGTTANDRFSNIVLNAGVNGVNNNFGEILAASLAGNVYYDANNNGVFEGTETGISGATVTLTGTDDLGASVTRTATTSGTGAYSFTGLRPGTYVITETQPAGYLDGIDTIGTPGGTTANDRFSNIVLNAGVNGINNNFGEVLANSSLAGNVYYDANNDGVFQGTETGIGGVTVRLTGTDNLGNSVNLTAVTAANGSYAFTNLRPGTYVLTETQPGAYLDGRDTIGTPGGTTANDQFSNIVLLAGVNGVNNNFGELLASSISGSVYCDANRDCIRQASEDGIAGATVRLTGVDDRGALIDTSAVTDSNGNYTFGNLRPGTYRLRETQPVNTVDSGDTVGSLGGTLANDDISNIVIRSGQNGTGYLFGEICQGEIRGTKFLDETGNGLTSDDTGFGGVTIYLDTNNNGVMDTGERRTVTAANGTYAFQGLNAGTYIVREVVQAGYVRTGPTNRDYYSVTVALDQTVTGIDFANAETCADFRQYITNIRFVINGTTTVTDLRGNVNQGDEVTAIFTIASNAPEAHRISLVSYTAPQPYFDANTASQQRIFEQDTGVFGPGTYSLSVHVPDCYFQIDFVCGAVIDRLGPAGSNIFYTPQARLLSADNDGTNDCNDNSACLTGNVYVDSNNDGRFGVDEIGISGVRVVLTGRDVLGNSVSITKYTDSYGAYSFNNLRAGTYTITETQPGSYVDGRDTIGSLGGTVRADCFTNIIVAAGQCGVNYNFGEKVTNGTLCTGDTATIGFWHNRNGQCLINSLNGGSYSTALGTWLATNFPNLYGSGAGVNNLAGRTNAQVAAAYQARFAVTGMKLDAQVMATALAVYVTNSGLAGGNYAGGYGFNVSSSGTGAKTFNVGNAGACFGIANNSVRSIMQLLQGANARVSGGSLWGTDATLRSLANNLFTSINERGDIV